MKKGVMLLTFTVLMLSVFSLQFVFALDNDSDETSKEDDLRCLSCGDSCYPVDEVAAMSCFLPTNGEPICGAENGECVVVGFGDDSNYKCEDMNKADCESAKGCESVFESPPCDGEVCTMQMIWKGCRYEGDEFFEEYEDEELKQKAGSVPGDTFYFIDRFFDRFGDDLSVKEERIAEIKQLIEDGDIEGAKVVLKDYMELADELEREIDPERREDAKRSAAAIRNAMKDIRDQLPEGERGRFVSDVMSREHKIATAAEIAGKIKDLCIQLSELDPLEYSKMCRTDDDDARWKKKLDKELSAEQEETAKEFVKIMSQCFETSGQDCACEEIPFYDFSIACSKAAPLAVACDIDGDEAACDDLDDLKMPELPDWLQPIWEDLEDDMDDAQYDMHMPRECVEAGATTRKACSVVMVKNNAPLECRSALLKAAEEGEVDRRVFERICDKIMMEQHAPRCVEKGITDPEECKRFMDSFRGDDRREGRPSQCNDAEMTNEECAGWILTTLGTPEPCAGMDETQCKKILIGAWGGPGNYEGPTSSFSGPDCGRIEDSTERLECYDNKGNEFDDHYGPRDGDSSGGEITWQCKENRIHWGPDCETFMREEWPEQERRRIEEGEDKKAQEEDWRVMEEECRSSCDLENGWWDFRDGECVCYTDERSSEPRPGEWGSDDYVESECKDGCNQECGDQNTDCVDGKCICLGGGDDSPQYAPGEGPGEPSDYQEGGQYYDGGSDSTDSSDDSSSAGSGSGETTDSSSSSEESSNTDAAETNTLITGEVISNRFLDYYDNQR